MTEIFKALFLSHGGGPMPLLGNDGHDNGHAEMVSCLQHIASQIPKPEAIVMVSAHWEESLPTITSAARPALIYDYYGFPDESYAIQYPAAGNPALAERLHVTLSESGITSRLDDRRGFDHGLFIPLKIMYPQADIPCVQLSLVNSLDALEHIAIGRALQSLHQENILVIGSGFSFHNLKAFFQPGTADTAELNRSFEAWLLDTCSDPELDEQTRANRLSSWHTAPGASYCHPREEHLIPLHVCYGIAQAPSRECFELEIMGKKSSMYLW